MNKSAEVSTASVTLSPKVPATISTKADLVQANKVLDNSDTQVNSSLNDSSLDADLNDML
jgi:hypothetical protein